MLEKQLKNTNFEIFEDLLNLKQKLKNHKEPESIQILEDKIDKEKEYICD